MKKCNKDLNEFLIEIDNIPSDIIGSDFPCNFNYNHTEERIYSFVNDLEKKIGKNLRVIDGYQDAMFSFTVNYAIPEGVKYDIDWPDTQPYLSIRFSNWGNLAATRNISGHPPIDSNELEIIKHTLDKYGFIWIDGDILKNMPYNGIYISSDTINSWWDRFFEYS